MIVYHRPANSLRTKIQTQFIIQCLLEFLPDSADIAGTTFSCALVEDNWELHLVPSLKLQAILHFFYMEEQLLALTNFIGDEAKLQERGNIKNK